MGYNFFATLFIIFYSIDKIPLITCPTLIVHSGMDRVTDFEHAKRFYDLCQTLVPPLIIPYAGHCHLLFYRAYWNRLEIFFFYELVSTVSVFYKRIFFQFIFSVASIF